MIPNCLTSILTFDKQIVIFLQWNKENLVILLAKDSFLCIFCLIGKKSFGLSRIMFVMLPNETIYQKS